MPESTKANVKIALPLGIAATGNIDRTLEFRALAELIPALVFMTDGEGANIYTNALFQRYCGVSAASLMDAGWLDVLHPEDHARAEQTWRESWALRQPYDVRYRFRRFDGEYRWHVVRGTPLTNTAGEAVRWIGACTDVDDLMRSISSDNVAAAVLSGLSTMPGLCIYAKDNAGRFRFASEATLAILAADASDVIGKTTTQLAQLDIEASTVQQNDAATLVVGKPCTFDEQWTDAFGKKRLFRSIKMPITLAEGERGILGVSIEASPEKIDIKLQAEVEILRAHLDAMPIVAFVANEKGQIISVNEAWRAASGCPAENAEFADVIGASNLDHFLDFWAYNVESGEILSIEVDVVDKLTAAPQRGWVIAVPTNVMTEDGPSLRWLGTIENVN